MKRILLAWAVLLLLLSGCGFRPAPERVVIRTMDALSAGKITKAESYMATSLGVDYKGLGAKKFYKAMFSTITYTIASSTVEEERAQVILSVTMVDMDTLLTKTSLELLGEGLTGGKERNKKLYALLRDAILSGDVPYTTSLIPVYLIHQEGKWLVDLASSGDFASAITGGLSQLLTY